MAPTIPAKSYWLSAAASDYLIGAKQRLKLDKAEMEYDAEKEGKRWQGRGGSADKASPRRWRQRRAGCGHASLGCAQGRPPGPRVQRCPSRSRVPPTPGASTPSSSGIN